MKFLYFVLLLTSMCVEICFKAITCPSYCVCDIFKNLRRATCQNRKLISLECEIPPLVEFLDLSQNLIHDLRDRIMVELNLSKISMLNVSHNKISQIHVHAFAEMDLVKTIDLSYNNLEYLLKNWFWDTPRLEELYLRGNNLHKLDEIIVESITLKVLDVSKCSLLYVHKNAFSKLPQLEILDLSENNLIQLYADTLKPCPNLRTLHIKDNNLSCNNVFYLLMDYCRNMGINTVNPCNTTKSSRQVQFQRIISATEKEQTFWLYDAITEKPKTANRCSCDTSSRKRPIFKLLRGLPILVSIITFCAGLGLGLVISYGINYTKPKRFRKRKLRRARPLNNLYAAFTDDFDVSETTPMPTRKEIRT